jgi:MFS family permease
MLNSGLAQRANRHSAFGASVAGGNQGRSLLVGEGRNGSALTFVLVRATMKGAGYARPGGRTLIDSGASTRGPQHDPLAVLRQRNFLTFVLSRLFAGTGVTLQQAVILWQVYQISGSALQLGLLGLVRFLPALGMSLIGGAVADSYNRRTVLLLAHLAPLATASALLISTSRHAATLPLIYGLVLVNALASSFENPARQALLPLIVPRELFVKAVAVSSTFQQLSFVGGPLIAGIAIARLGVGGAYAINVALVVGAILMLLAVRPRREQSERQSVSVAAIKEGILFVRRWQVLLGAMALDMFAVIFAGAQALLPIYAEDILKVGPRGYGMLTSAQAIGSFAMAVTLVALPPVRNAGRALLASVAAFGLATVLFGVSRSFPLSLAAYAATGMADQVSMVIRQTTIQLATPDALRGRVSAVNQVFIGASNQLGAIESGFVAALTSATFAVVSGGIGCMAVVALIAARMPDLRRYVIAPAAIRHVTAADAVRAGSARAAAAPDTRPLEPTPHHAGDS